MAFAFGSFRSVMGGRAGLATDAVVPTQEHLHDQMAGIISGLREQGKPLTLGSLWEAGQQQGLSAYQVADLSGQDLRGFTFEQKDLDKMRGAARNDGLQINLKGANISDAVFRPASTFNGVMIDECTVMGSTMQNMRFEGLSGEQANLNFSGVDVSGLALRGAQADSPARSVNVNLTNSVAANMDMADSRLANVHATASTLDGLNAQGARALGVQVQGGSLREANFEGASFAPGSAIVGADLRGASFAGADVSELGMTGSQMNAQGLVGAYYKGTAITTETAAAVAAEKGLTLSGGEAMAQRQWPPTPGADSFEAQLVAARGGADKTRGGEQADVAYAQSHLAQFRPQGQGAGLGA